MEKEIQALQEDLKQAEKDLKNFTQKSIEAKTMLQKMEEDFEWIKTEKQYFGLKGQIYDFESLSLKDFRKKLVSLTDDLQEKKKNVNFKVDVMFEETNQRYQQLMVKRETIL